MSKPSVASALIGIGLACIALGGLADGNFFFGLFSATGSSAPVWVVDAKLTPSTPDYAQLTWFNITIQGVYAPCWINFTYPDGRWSTITGGQSKGSLWELRAGWSFCPRLPGEVRYSYGYMNGSTSVEVGNGSIPFSLSGAPVTTMGIGSLRHTSSTAPSNAVEVGYIFRVVSNVAVREVFARIVDADTGTVIASESFGDFPPGERTVDRFLNGFRFPMRTGGDYHLRLEVGAEGRVYANTTFVVKNLADLAGGAGEAERTSAPSRAALMGVGAVLLGCGLVARKPRRR